MSDHRFWAKVSVVESGCWEYRARNSGGYGSVKRRGRVIGAHRWSYELTHGPIPPAMSVCHRCDNPPCVRPDHLFLGSVYDNAKDRDSKGRGRGGPIAAYARHEGERNGRSKVSSADVEDMRRAHAAGETNKALAARYGISVSSAHRIVTGRSWR